jgi:hypothetical protein
MRFGTMGTKSPRLKREEQGDRLSQPIRPKDPDQRAHNQGSLETIIM